MRLRFLFIALFACTSEASAQGNCSDGSTGVIVSIRSTEISPDGSQFTACFAVEGDPALLLSAMVAGVEYNPDGIHPDFSAAPIIPAESPFPTADYETEVLFCLGEPEECPYYEMWVYKAGNQPPFIPLPAEPVEFVCVIHNIQDPSETAGMGVVSIDAVDGDFNPIPACPAVDQGHYDGPLPVELVSFRALVESRVIVLDWETASESNNAGFEVQLQRDGYWEALGWVEGHSSTTEAQVYGFTAVGLGVGTHVFRLKQIDFDGSFEYHGNVEGTIGTPGTHLLNSAYPNPFNPNSQFTLSVATDQRVKAELYNTLGQRVAVLFDGTVVADHVRSISIDGANLPSGLYVVRVNGAHFTDALHVTLLK